MKTTKTLSLFSTAISLLAISLSLAPNARAGGAGELSTTTSTPANEASTLSTPSTAGQQNSVVQSTGNILQFNSVSTPPYQGCSGFCLYGRLGVSNSNANTLNTLNVSSSNSNIQAELGFTAQVGGSVEGKQVEANTKIAMMEQDRMDTQLNVTQARELGRLVDAGKKAEAISVAIAIFKRLGYSTHTELLKTMGATW